MIYNQIDTTAAALLQPIETSLKLLTEEIKVNREAHVVEDSIRRKGELTEEYLQLCRQERHMWGEVEAIRIETFKNLLAEEYGVTRTHDKFDKLFNLAWSMGHSSGFSDVENYFMRWFADLLDPIPAVPVQPASSSNDFQFARNLVHQWVEGDDNADRKSDLRQAVGILDRISRARKD